ncbi:XRE family transcriptional regulator [Micromonospora sp. WP24]|uniref:ATP-binding protein n=1 Tax=Micromonospora sp. WP24 TaxID=2604469 RepID=UPI0011D7A60F|nr:helix-turn-helix domain-containing protein [Micromonospora sp. WP24]TYB99590.1 XRE family transcriptional regulator [Micromonospora sp. WP24]
MTPARDRSPDPGGGAALPELLRGHRLAAALTQAELADRAGVGVRTVRDLERGRSSRPQRTTVELLAGALDLAGAARTAFLAAARGPTGEPANPSPGPVEPSASGPGEAGLAVTLPPPVELIGRDRDVDELVTMLTDELGPRLVSLVGLAGVGKSALALTVGHAVAESHPVGVAGVLIGEGSDAYDVFATSMAVLGAGRAPELAARLAGRPVLLVVDAAERAPGPVAEVLHRLIAAVPSLRVLVTGRHPVGLSGERVWPVTPLEVPPAEAEVAGPAALTGWPAVELFLARLAQVRREPPVPAELPAIAALVRRLGGLPLAIELMAARGRILDPAELLDRYGDRVLDLATPDRGAQSRGWEPGGAEPYGPTVAVTLRDAVAASYRLLAPEERLALRRLAAFGHRWSVDLAEEMLACDADADGTVAIDPIPVLDRLVELGLLSVSGPGPLRFRLLDAVREFAIEQAAGTGELARIRRRHAAVIAGLVTRTVPDLVGARLTDAVRRLDDLNGDISSALSYAATHDPLTALRLAAGLPRWWRFRGRDMAGRRWLRRLLADPRTADAEPALRAWAALGAARLAAEHGAADEELPGGRAALATFRNAGDVSGQLAAGTVLGSLLIRTGRPVEAREQAEAVLRLATRHGRIRDVAVAQNNLAWHEVRLADLAAARRRLAAVDRIAAQCGEPRLRVLARANLAEVARLEGRYCDAIDQGHRVLAMLAELGDPGHRRRVLGRVGLALAQDGRADEAAEVLAELRTCAPMRLRLRPPGEQVVPRQRSVVPTAGTASREAGWRWPHPEAGICALVEGNLALHQGDRELAAEWFSAAVEAGADDYDRRDTVEALVGLASSTGDPAVLDRLELVCREGAIRLLPHEEELLYALAANRDGRASR